MDCGIFEIKKDENGDYVVIEQLDCTETKLQTPAEVGNYIQACIEDL